MTADAGIVSRALRLWAKFSTFIFHSLDSGIRVFHRELHSLLSREQKSGADETTPVHRHKSCSPPRLLAGGRIRARGVTNANNQQSSPTILKDVCGVHHFTDLEQI